jgi:hypothetical protein
LYLGPTLASNAGAAVAKVARERIHRVHRPTGGDVRLPEVVENPVFRLGVVRPPELRDGPVVGFFLVELHTAAEVFGRLGFGVRLGTCACAHQHESQNPKQRYR